MTDLLSIYEQYLTCLNDRRWDDLGRFVADDVTYNGEQVGLTGYRAMLEADTHAIPDLSFEPDLLLADDQVVACRLYFRCTPQRPFLGLEPTGRQVSFPEHVFYRFDERRIAQVWSLIDKDTVRAQLNN